MIPAFISIFAFLLALVTITCVFVVLVMKKEFHWATASVIVVFCWLVFGYMITTIVNDILYYYTL